MKKELQNRTLSVSKLGLVCEFRQIWFGAKITFSICKYDVKRNNVQFRTLSIHASLPLNNYSAPKAANWETQSLDYKTKHFLDRHLCVKQGWIYVDLHATQFNKGFDFKRLYFFNFLYCLCVRKTDFLLFLLD